MTQKIVFDPEQKDPFKYCMELEAGNILFFPKISLDLSEQKNGFEQYLARILSPYASEWKSFEDNAKNGDGERLQVDTAASRPVHGARILRIFTNTSQTETLTWTTSQSFGSLVDQFGGSKGVSFPKTMDYSLKGRLDRKFKELLRTAGLNVSLRSPYDSFMLRMDKFLKKNEEFQKNSPKLQWEFPPNSSWVVFTDLISHSKLSGVSEQSFLIPQKALLCPEKSPVAILERLSGRNVVDLKGLSALFE